MPQPHKRRSTLIAVIAAVALGAFLLGMQLRGSSDQCTPKPADPEQYLVRICEYLRAQQIDVAPGDPNRYAIKRIEERVEDGRPVLWVFLNCCAMGDIAVIDQERGEVIRFQLGPH